MHMLLIYSLRISLVYIVEKTTQISTTLLVLLQEIHATSKLMISNRINRIALLLLIIMLECRLI
jgi:hypothetical protein